MTDSIALRDACRDAVAGAGLTVVGELFHTFPAPGGVTGMLLLAESHLAVHTWPEFASVTIDLFVCNGHADNGARATAALDAVVKAFAPRHVQRQRLVRASVATSPPSS